MKLININLSKLKNLNKEHINVIIELFSLVFESDPVIAKDLKRIQVGSKIDKNIIKKTMDEVTDPDIKKEFEHRLNNADYARKVELVGRYGPLLLSDRIVRSVIDKRPKSYTKSFRGIFNYF